MATLAIRALPMAIHAAEHIATHIINEHEKKNGSGTSGSGTGTSKKVTFGVSLGGKGKGGGKGGGNKNKNKFENLQNFFESGIYTVDNDINYLIHHDPPKLHKFGAFDFFSPLNYNNMFHYDFGAPKKRKVGRPKKGRGRPKGKGKKTTKRTTTKKKGTSTKKSIYELVFTSKIHGIAKPVGIYKKRLVSVGSLAYKRWKHTTKYKFEHVGKHPLEPKTNLFRKIGLKTKGKGGRPKKTGGKTAGKTSKTAKFGFGCGSGGCGGYGRFGREMYPSNYHFGNQGFYPTLGSTMGPYPSAFVTPISPVSTVTGTGTKAAFGRARYGCNNRFGRSMDRY